MLFNKTSPGLVNAEYNYHDSLQSRLMSGGTFVDQPSKSRLSGFFSLFVSSQRNWVKALLFHIDLLCFLSHCELDDKRRLRAFYPSKFNNLYQGTTSCKDTPRFT